MPDVPGLRRPAGSAAAAVLVALFIALTGVPAAAAGAGYVRLAHLSPDTPAVDVYLRSRSGSVPEKVFPGVRYGAFSGYLRLPTGSYSVAMRKAGAPRTVAPVLTTQLTVEDGAAYTVAGVGRYADLGLRVLRDDLTLPAAGQAKVRIVQASVRAPVLDVGVDRGATIGTAVPFASTTGYRQVKPGNWTLTVRPSGGGRAAALPCTLRDGSVYSVLVLDGVAGGLRTRVVTDAGRQGVVPAGGVPTGAGGSAPAPVAPIGLTAAVAAALLVGLVTAVALRYQPERR